MYRSKYIREETRYNPRGAPVDSPRVGCEEKNFLQMWLKLLEKKCFLEKLRHSDYKLSKLILGHMCP